MPKENTHLYFAHRLLCDTEEPEWRNIINKELEPYYLGAIAPDVFYYSGEEKTRRISETLHGRDGSPTNGIVFELLERAKANKSGADLAFALGYLTHCALDITFHPVIYYLSGNYFDHDFDLANEAMYLHRHLETYLDKKVNQDFFFHHLINLRHIRTLDFPKLFHERFGVPLGETEILLRRKNLASQFENSRLVYYLFYFLYKLGLKKIKLFLGLFYANLTADPRVVPDLIDYRDIITGEKKRDLITDLFDRADNLASAYFEAAIDYFDGKIGRPEAEKFIQGESLNTGRFGLGVQNIKFTYNSHQK